MKITQSFAIEKFRQYNESIFKGALPEPPILLCNVKTFLGKCTYKIRRRLFSKPEYYDFKLRFNQRIDLPENELEDIIIHEMIHYYIEYNRIKDSSAHGKVFRKMMDDINHQYGRHITISHKLTNEQRDQLIGQQAPRVVAVISMTNGRRGIKILPEDSQKIREYCQTVSASRNITDIKLYLSNHPTFQRYPKSAAFNLFSIDPQLLDQSLQDAQPIPWENKK